MQPCSVFYVHRTKWPLMEEIMDKESAALRAFPKAPFYVSERLIKKNGGRCVYLVGDCCDRSQPASPLGASEFRDATWTVTRRAPRTPIYIPEHFQCSPYTATRICTHNDLRCIDRCTQQTRAAHQATSVYGYTRSHIWRTHRRKERRRIMGLWKWRIVLVARRNGSTYYLAYQVQPARLKKARGRASKALSSSRMSSSSGLLLETL